MKKILMLTLTAFVFCCQSVLADVVKTEQSFKDNKAVIAIQKQPATENFQKQSVKNNRFCVVVQVNVSEQRLEGLWEHKTATPLTGAIATIVNQPGHTDVDAGGEKNASEQDNKKVKDSDAALQPAKQ